MNVYDSDSHCIKSQGIGEYILGNFFPTANYYADGKQALIHLYKSQGWKRLWVPEYFCNDVIKSLTKAGLDLRYYADHPGYTDDNKTLEVIHKKGYFHPKDAVLRVNFFGTRSYRSTEKLPIAVVEDHTHDLIGEWALRSDAEWCIASLRETLPIPDGGILWSPVGLCLPKATNECTLNKASWDCLQTFDIHSWYLKKRENWEILSNIKKEGVKILKPESYGCYPFSLILVFDDFAERDRVRKELIEKQVFPEILWDVLDPKEGDVFKMSRSMLSIPCDGRYSQDDILQLKTLIESVL